MMLGQLTEPFYIQPTGYVNSFAIRFYPYGFANFVSTPLHALANTETPLFQLFGVAADELSRQMVQATSTEQRIAMIEQFLLQQLEGKAVRDNIVQSTIDTLLATGGSLPINDILKKDPSKRRQLERKFARQIGISPKQLSRVIRLQSALQLLLHQQPASLTQIAYESDYYDQAHFIKDFTAFTGTSPKAFLKDNQLALSALFYTPR